MSTDTGNVRIAVAAEGTAGLDSAVSAHFGRCAAYILVTTRDGEILSHETVENPHCEQHVPGAVPQFLAGLKPDVVLAGGMGPRAVTMLNKFGIEVTTGITGSVADGVATWFAGTRGIVPCDHDHPDSCGGHHD